ncbi:hypothetical protein B566_EDAN001225 [Ephemera danica]|nr:hypothetical protein B566_EDAN001225 [Ephemera danica]
MTTSAFTTVIPKSHTVTSGSLTTSGPTTVIPQASHTVTRGSLNVVPSATKNVQQPKAPNNADVLQPCNALYIDNLFPAGTTSPEYGRLIAGYVLKECPGVDRASASFW